MTVTEIDKQTAATQVLPVTQVPLTKTLPAVEHSVGTRIDGLVGVTRLDSSVGNVTIVDGKLVASLGNATQGAHIFDATGWRIIPAASEPHAHLDKAYSAQRFDYFFGTELNSLESAISQWVSLLPEITEEDIYARALKALQQYASKGITTVRTHVDFPQSGDPLRGVKAIAQLQEALAGLMNVQIVGLAGHLTPVSVIKEAIEVGMTHIGGCPHLAPNPHEQTTRYLDLVEETGLPMDLHTDEQLSTHELDLEDLADQIISRGITTNISASHNVRLGQLDKARLNTVLDKVKQANIGLIALPITNLYLQSRDHATFKPRGLPPLAEILAAGIPLAAGADNLRDPFNPAGTGDPFETTSLLMTAGHLAPSQALQAVTTGARTVLGLPQVGDGTLFESDTDSGTDADFMLVPNTDIAEVLAGTVHTRIVVHKGRIISDTRTTTNTLIT